MVSFLGTVDLAFVGHFFADDHAEERGLAGAVGTDQADLLAGIQLEGGVDEDQLLAVLLVDVGEGDHRTSGDRDQGSGSQGSGIRGQVGSQGNQSRTGAPDGNRVSLVIRAAGRRRGGRLQCRGWGGWPDDAVSVLDNQIAGRWWTSGHFAGLPGVHDVAGAASAGSRVVRLVPRSSPTSTGGYQVRCRTARDYSVSAGSRVFPVSVFVRDRGARHHQLLREHRRLSDPVRPHCRCRQRKLSPAHRWPGSA